jgi:hypothetical protein
MSSCSVYKNTVLLGTGSITNGGNLTGFTGSTLFDTTNGPIGKNIQIQITSSTDNGKTFGTRVTVSAAAGATLTLYPINPFAT